MTDRLAHNLGTIRERLARAAAAADRDPAGIMLLAVSKSVQPEIAAGLARLGQVDFGENRLEGLDPKRAYFDAHGLPARWHFIGHIQRNKARRVVERSDVIHSIDSVRLLKTVIRHAEELERSPDIYLQVKIADEADKHGMDPTALPEAIELTLAARPHVRLVGLMVMAPLVGADAERRAAARAVFEQTRDLAVARPELKLGLSMGMTGDFEEAVHAGSTVLRIGSALFEGVVSQGAPHGQ